MPKSRHVHSRVGALLLVTFAACAASVAAQPGTGAPRQEQIRSGPAAERKPVTPVFDPNLNVKQAIDAAVARATADNRRVIVVWGWEGDPWAVRLRDQFAALDAARIIKYHYEVVWADIADPTAGPLNMAVAQIYGVQPDPKKKPLLTVLHGLGDATGQALVTVPTDGWEDPRKARSSSPDYALYKIHQFLLSHKPPALKAGQIIDKANTDARSRSVPVMLNFVEPFEPWCVKFRTWMEQPEIASIMAKHFVLAWVDLERMDGSEQALDRYGGKNADTLPWFVFIDVDGRRLAPEAGTPGKKEVALGFPTGEEVPQFAQFLKTAAPGITEAELKTIQDSLRAASEPAKAPAGTP